ncbi:MAG: glycine zipper 2TM domain-containing protein [Pseudomonadota bacterium]
MTTSTPRTNPLVIAAAASVILLSGVGIAKMMNWLPASSPEAIAEEAKVTAEADKATADAKANSEKAAEAKTASAQKAEICSSCGVITDISPVTQAAQPSGLGAVAGAVVGGVLGNQVGGGSGKKVATVAGVVGGAYAGNVIEGKTRTTTSYRVRVRFEDGRRDSFSYAQAPSLDVGTRVQIRNGELVPR